MSPQSSSPRPARSSCCLTWKAAGDRPGGSTAVRRRLRRLAWPVAADAGGTRAASVPRLCPHGPSGDPAEGVPSGRARAECQGSSAAAPHPRGVRGRQTRHRRPLLRARRPRSGLVESEIGPQRAPELIEVRSWPDVGDIRRGLARPLSVGAALLIFARSSPPLIGLQPQLGHRPRGRGKARRPPSTGAVGESGSCWV